MVGVVAGGHEDVLLLVAKILDAQREVSLTDVLSGNLQIICNAPLKFDVIY